MEVTEMGALSTEDESIPPSQSTDEARLENVVKMASLMAQVFCDSRVHRAGDECLDPLLRAHYAVCHDLALFATTGCTRVAAMPVAWGLFAALTVAFAATVHVVAAIVDPEACVVADLTAACAAVAHCGGGGGGGSDGACACGDARRARSEGCELGAAGAARLFEQPVRQGQGSSSTAVDAGCHCALATSEAVYSHGSTEDAARAIAYEVQRVGSTVLETLDALRVGGRNATYATLARAHFVDDLSPATITAWQALKATAAQCLVDTEFMRTQPPPTVDFLYDSDILTTLLRVANDATHAAYAAITAAPPGNTGISAHMLHTMQRRVYCNQCTPLEEDPPSSPPAAS